MQKELRTRGADMLEAAGWMSVKHLVYRQVLSWTGHVARMSKERMPKMAMFGGWEGHDRRSRERQTQNGFIRLVLREAGIPELDWFRLAQDKRGRAANGRGLSIGRSRRLKSMTA